MKTTRQIAEELFGEASPQGWRARVGHAISEDKFNDVIRALDRARDEGRIIQREHEARMRERLYLLLRAIRDAREKLLSAVTMTKSSFDDLEGSFAAKVLEMRMVLEDEVQTPPNSPDQ